MIVLGIQQEICPHNGHTDSNDNQNQKYKEHETVNIVHLQKPQEKKPWVTWEKHHENDDDNKDANNNDGMMIIDDDDNDKLYRNNYDVSNNICKWQW